MDYPTLFTAYCAFLTVYTVFAASLAWRNREVTGLSWIAAGLVLNLVKVVLQGLDDHIPVVLSALLVNQLYLASFIFQFLGLRWFVTRVPIRRRWPLYLVIALAVIYVPLYFLHVRYISNLINIPVAVCIGYTGIMLVRRGKDLFQQVARWTAAFLSAECAVSIYRAALTNLRYTSPWSVGSAHQDPNWVYSLMAMMILSSCVLMCDLWFFVVELQRVLVEQARTDSLTGALNRRALYGEAEREISRTLRSGHHFSVLLFDVDDFKVMNDTRGHAAGDYVLQSIVNSVRGILRTPDWLARTGGEEFAVLLPETDITQAANVAERLCHAVADLDLIFESSHFHISISIGVAQLSSKSPTLDNLLHRADAAMYSAKREGKNRVGIYRDGMTSDPDFDHTTLAGLIDSPAH